jgi:Amt family ammonium transporter
MKFLRLAPIALLALATPALAEPASKIDAGDTAWMIAATALVLMMTIPGLALFYAGMVRKKNVLATMAQSVAAVCIVSILWALLGYTLSFSGDAPALGNLDRALLRGIGMDTVSPLAKTIPESLFMIYQMTFAIITVALVSGAVADRMRFSAFVLFSILWLFIVYVPLAHWVWGGGFLQTLGPARFRRRHRGAHQCGRRGTRRRARARQAARLRHGKSRALRSVDGGDRHRACSGSAGSASTAARRSAPARAPRWRSSRRILPRAPARSPGCCSSGRIATSPPCSASSRARSQGLGTITPASGFVLPWHGIVIGIVAGGACYWACTRLKLWLGYDDSLDVFGVHGVGGFLGVTLTGVFATAAVSIDASTPNGFPGLIDGNPRQVLIQLAGAAVTIAWSGIGTLVILKLVGAVTALRVTPEAEQIGLDVTLHGESIHS